MQFVFHLLIAYYCKYLLLTELDVRTGSYGPSFSNLIYGPSAVRAGHKSKGKNEDNLQYQIADMICRWMTEFCVR